MPYHKHVFLPVHRCGEGEIETYQFVVWGIVILFIMYSSTKSCSLLYKPIHYVSVVQINPIRWLFYVKG